MSNRKKHFTDRLAVSKTGVQIINYAELEKVLQGHNLHKTDHAIYARILEEENANIRHGKTEEVHYHLVSLKSRYGDKEHLMEDLEKLEEKEGLVKTSLAKLAFFDPGIFHRITKLKATTLGFTKTIAGVHEFHPVKTKPLSGSPRIKFVDAFSFGADNIRLLFEESEARRKEENIRSANVRASEHQMRKRTQSTIGSAVPA